MTDDPLTVIHGDCVEVMATLPEASVGAIVTDPPYSLGFMGKAWDATGIANDPQMWARALRVLKPGGYLLAFGGTRTFHRMTCAIEDAGFTVRDVLSWLYGSGFPKSLDVSKAFDKKAGVEREVVGPSEYAGRESGADLGRMNDDSWRGGAPRVVTSAATALARKWDGWGTALKPAWEPIVLAQKPLDGTYVANIEKYGVGALNIDGARIDAKGEQYVTSVGGERVTDNLVYGKGLGVGNPQHAAGRWPANVILDDEAARMLDAQSGERPVSGSAKAGTRSDATPTGLFGTRSQGVLHNDSGGASRFFYVAKASRTDRGNLNTHPTVKPVELMRYLVKLITPTGGLVLDPFAGSGTTGQAALAEGFRCVLIEREAEYVRGIRDWRGAMQLGTGIGS